MASAVRTVCSDCAAATLCGLDMLNTMDQVADIQSRVLLMQGSEDCVTPLSNAATMMSVMEEAGVRATLLPIEGPGLQIAPHGHSYVYAHYNPVSSPPCVPRSQLTTSVLCRCWLM